MAKINKLQAAFDAFANKDQNAATKLFREFFVENARAVNRKLERQLNEEFGGDQEEDLFNDVDADEGDQDEGFDNFEDDEEPEEGDGDFGDDFSSEEPETIEITPEKKESIRNAIDELEAIMAELGGDDFGGEDEGDDFGVEPEEDSVEFGDEPEEDEDGLKESFQMKSVKTPDMKEQGDVNTKSPVAKVQSPFGIKGTDQEFKSSTAKGTNDKLDTSVPASKEENFSNVNANGKSVYKKATEKKVKQPEGQENNQSILKDFRGKK